MPHPEEEFSGDPTTKSAEGKYLKMYQVSMNERQLYSNF